MSAVRVRHRPPAFARGASFGSASRTEPNCAASEGCRAGVAKQRRRAGECMKYVYILRSVAFPDRYYTGIAED
jgi:hypothetical protein